MKMGLMGVLACMAVSVFAEPGFKYSFNQFEDGPIEGQFEWNIYNKVKDSSALSIVDELGTSEARGDKALVIKASEKSFRCVTGEPVRWLPGRTLTTEFDFKIAVGPTEFVSDKPVMTLMVGNSLLSEKTRFSIALMATANGDWKLEGYFPDVGTKSIYGENFLIRSNTGPSISEWYHFSLVVKKRSEPDSFETSVEVRHGATGKMLTAMRFTDDDKGKVTKALWNTSRVHVGFGTSADQYGVVCIDNLTIFSEKN